jgi:hypothetical protein
LFDYDHLLVLNHLFFDLLLCIRGQSSSALCLRAHPLDGVHHIGFLRQKGVTEIGSPLNIVGETFHHVGQSRHRLNARIPRLFLNRLDQFCLVFDELRVFVEPLPQLNDLERISRCRQRLGQQWIRIERNRCDQRIELLSGYLHCLLIVGLLCFLLITTWLHS